jgi:hypothetical protein
MYKGRFECLHGWLPHPACAPLQHAISMADAGGQPSAMMLRKHSDAYELHTVNTAMLV